VTRQTAVIIVCVLALVLALPAVAVAGNGSPGGQGQGAGEQTQAKGGEEPEQQTAQEGTQERAQTSTREQTQQQTSGECAPSEAQTRTRAREESREGEYPEEVPGEGDRSRVRERPSEDTETVEPTRTVEALEDSRDHAGQKWGDPHEGLLAGIHAWVTGVLESFGLG
jgi:hypothetical protein